MTAPDPPTPGEPSTPDTTGATAARKPPGRLSRRTLVLGGAGTVVIAGGAAGGVAYGRHVSAVDRVGRMTVHVSTREVTPGDLYYTRLAEPGAPVRASTLGKVRWVGPEAKSVADFRQQRYRGEPVYTWWESDVTGLAAYAAGRSVVADERGREIVSWAGDPASRTTPDEHEFLLAPDDTAYVTSYVRSTADLRAVGGERDGVVMDAQCVHVDLATGEVIDRWSPLQHVDLAESYAGVPDDPTEPWDFFHLNSIEPLPDGEVLLSARHTWTLYKIDPRSGEITWRLGGKRSDFAVDSVDARFAWQHDARWEPDGLIRLFDNGSDGTIARHGQSAVRWLELDAVAGSVHARRVLQHPEAVQADAMGNAQVLPNGHVLVGWGSAARISEFDLDDNLVFDATLPEVSYRAYKTPH